MTRRVRPTEHKAVVKILLNGVSESEQTEDISSEAGEMATDIINAIDDLREKRQDFFVILSDPGVGVSLFGPYVTKSAAQKARGTQIVAATKGARSMVVRLIPSEYEGVDLIN